MMTSATRLLLACAVLAVVTQSTVGSASNDKAKALPPIQAELETEYVFPDGRRIVVMGRLFRTSDGRIREEQGDMVTIADTAAGKMTILNSSTKEAIHFTFDEELRDPESSRPETETTGTQRSTESVGSYEAWPVRKHAVDQGDSSREVWTAPAIGLIVYGRMVSPQVTTTKRLRNIAVEAPMDALFTVPAGYNVKEHRVARPPTQSK